MKKQDEIYFRSSRSGDIMTDVRGAVITEKQLVTWNDYATRLREGGNLTVTQQKTFKELTAKKNKPFELSDTAKGAVRDIWLMNEKRFVKDIKSKYLDKGIYGEESGISLSSEVDGRFYSKNTERIHKGNRTGECDVKFKLDGKKIITDIKCCWDADTFMRADMSNGYEWQGRDYMDLYDADEFWLRYCLVDCPEHLVVKQQEYKWREFFSDTMDDEQQHELQQKVQPLLDQIERNLVYTKSGLYTPEERVKTFKITRDDKIFKQYLDRIPHCLKYYKTIKLNGNT